MYVAHYAFYEACILCGCDMSTGFFLYEYVDMDIYVRLRPVLAPEL